MNRVLLILLVLIPIQKGALSQKIEGAYQFIDGQTCHITQMKTDGAKNFYVTGYFQGTVNYNPAGKEMEVTAAGSRDIFVAKYDENYHLLWMNQIKQQHKFANTWSFLDVDGIGNVYVGGSFEKGLVMGPEEDEKITTFGHEDIYILKMNEKGRTMWWRHIGGLHMDQASSVAADKNGDIIVTGHFSGPVDFDPGEGQTILNADTKNVFIAKYSSQGIFEWVKQIEEDHNEGSTAPQLAIDSENNIILAGQFNGNPHFDFENSENISLNSDEMSNLYVAKYDPKGKLIWISDISHSGYSPYSEVNALSLSKSGKILISGWINHSIKEEKGNGIMENLVVPNAFVAQVNPDGKVDWNILLKSDAPNFSSGIGSNEIGEVFLGGGFRGFLGLSNGQQLIANGLDAIVLKLSHTGEIIDVNQIGGNGDQEFGTMAVRSDGKVLAIGNFNGGIKIESKSKPVIYVKNEAIYYPLVVVLE